MQVSFGAALLCAGCAIVIVRPDMVNGFYEQLYPSTPEQRRALNECFTQDPNFDRLDPAAREACYRHVLPSAAAVAARARATAAGNFVDLWRAAGQGRLPQNDMRFEQQNRR